MNLVKATKHYKTLLTSLSIFSSIDRQAAPLLSARPGLGWELPWFNGAFWLGKSSIFMVDFPARHVGVLKGTYEEHTGNCIFHGETTSDPSVHLVIKSRPCAFAEWNHAVDGHTHGSVKFCLFPDV